MIPDDVVERVGEAADIVQIIGEHVKLKRVGNSYRGACPFHQGTHDNFSVMPGRGYRCFVCGESGSVFTFVQKRLGLDFVEAVKYVGAKAGVEVPEVSRRREGPDPREPFWELNGAAAAYFRHVLWEEDLGAPARDYLAQRGVTREDADRFGLGFAPREIGLMRAHLQTLGFDDPRQLEGGLLVKKEDVEEPRPRFRGRLMFPIYDVQGRVIAFGGRVIGQGEPKYLNSPESPTFVKGRTLYGLNWAKNAVRRADRVFLVEGYFDCVRLMLAGVEEVVAPLGTALTEPQAELLRRYTRNVFLLYDSDQAGLKATFRAGDELLRLGMSVQVVTLPDGEDPDTFVRAHGREGLEAHVSAAVDVFERKIQILERGGWFSDLRRKRKALDHLLPTLRAVSDALTRDLYIHRTAETAGVSRELLEREIGHDAGPHGPPPQDEEPPPVSHMDLREPAYEAAPRPVRHRGRPTRASRAERELVRIMVHRPGYVEVVAERIGPQEFHDPLLAAIYARVADAPAGWQVHDLLAGLDADAGVLVQELLGEDGGLDDADRTIRDCLTTLQEQQLRESLREIDRQLPLAQGAEQDELVRRKTQLTDEWRSLGGRGWKSFGRTRS
ncbi:MAG TPA: DNA primase [Gemmatimonadaceae bacterium]|nr:DNA primase [Gemmatimonadaceae bacterium]